MFDLSEEYQKKNKPTYGLKVVDVRPHGQGRFVDIWLEQPESMRFAPLDGIGVPGALTDDDFSEIKTLLKPGALTDDDFSEIKTLLKPGGDTDDAVSYLRPQNGYPGPDYASPSDTFLQDLLGKAEEEAKHAGNKTLEKHTACLWAAMQSPDTKEILKANYTVIDLLRLFPGIMTAKDILSLQPPEHGNKTYTVDARPLMHKNGKTCFRLSVARNDGKAYRALFGEADPEGMKTGLASTHLRNLKPGDTLTINAKVKAASPLSIPQDPGRPLLLVAQGNAMIRLLSALEDIRKKRAGGQKIGPVTVIGTFQKKDDVLELDNLKPYLDDGTLDEAHICLSREEKGQAEKDDKITFHKGIRAQDLIADGKDFLLEKPFVYVCGGESFCESEGSVSKALADHYGYKLSDNEKENRTGTDIQVRSSPNRRHVLQGGVYSAVDPEKALQQFLNRSQSQANILSSKP